jgi:hypothetical protein
VFDQEYVAIDGFPALPQGSCRPASGTRHTTNSHGQAWAGGSWIGRCLGIIKKLYVLVYLLEVMLGAAAQNLAVCNAG